MSPENFQKLPKSIRVIPYLYELMENGILTEQDLVMKGQYISSNYLPASSLEEWMGCLKTEGVINLIAQGVLYASDFVKKDAEGYIQVMQPGSVQLWLKAIKRPEIAELLAEKILTPLDLLIPHTKKMLQDSGLEKLINAINVPGIKELIESQVLKVSDLWLEQEPHEAYTEVMPPYLVKKLTKLLAEHVVQEQVKAGNVYIKEFLTKGKYGQPDFFDLETVKQLVAVKVDPRNIDRPRLY